MEKQERLPDDLVFEPDGHVTEAVLTCLADGELALVSEAATLHVDACDACTARLGAAALRSLDAGEVLRNIDAPAEARVAPLPAAPAAIAAGAAETLSQPGWRARRPMPYAAIAMALAVAVVAGAPGLLDALAASPDLLRSVRVFTRVVLVLLRSRPEGLFTATVLLRWASALVLIVTGSAVARAMTRSRALEGGMG